MKAKEFIPASKPRNFVVKNQKTAGAGAHKDKKRAEKQGDVKHKQKQFEQGVAEGDFNTPFSGAGGARRRGEPDSTKIDAMLAKQDQQRRDYEQTVKFWIKQKDTQQQISK